MFLPCMWGLGAQKHSPGIFSDFMFVLSCSVDGQGFANGGVLMVGLAASREETKGSFCKRAVLANVPSFRFWG